FDNLKCNIISNLADFNSQIIQLYDVLYSNYFLLFQLARRVNHSLAKDSV
ncbi:MAG: hypothetical protein RLZZ135_1565, partial [Cyanobacteriota bacterium]